MNDKIFVGSCKAKVFDNGGSIVKIGISKKDIETMQANMNGNGYCNLELCEMKQPNDKGNTHYIKIDTWKPDTSQARQSLSQDPVAPVDNENNTASQGFDNFDDDIPF